MAGILNKQFNADILEANNILLNGVNIDNYSILSESSSNTINDISGDYKLVLSSGMLDSNKNYTLFINDNISKVKVSKVIYYVSPYGTDSNDGLSRETPLQTLTKIPNYSSVMLLNGSYTSYTGFDNYKAPLNCLYAPRALIGMDIFGESKSGVKLYRTNTSYSEDPVFHYGYDCTFRDMTLYVSDRGTSNFQNTISMWLYNCVISNVVFNITGSYCLLYRSGTLGDSYYLKYINCSFNGGTKINNRLKVNTSYYDLSDSSMNITRTTSTEPYYNIPNNILINNISVESKPSDMEVFVNIPTTNTYIINIPNSLYTFNFDFYLDI